MKTERRESLETINVPAEPLVPGRRPPSEREASDTRTVWKHRGRGEGMSAKDQGVNTGNPSRWAASAQPAGREAQAGLDRVADRPVVAVKRVTIAERRGLSSRVRFEGARARGLAMSLATSLKRSAVPESLRCLSEPSRLPCGCYGWATAFTSLSESRMRYVAFPHMWRWIRKPRPERAKLPRSAT
jgi:hypothetical protein